MTTRIAWALIGVVVGVSGALGLQFAQPQPGPTGSPQPTRDSSSSIVSRTLPAGPTDIEMRGQREGYISMGDGRILRFQLGEDDELTLDEVATDLHLPRGVALQGSTLYVTELGPMPCDEPYPLCVGQSLRPEDPARGEVEIIEGSNARVTAYAVRTDGSLERKRVILDMLPVVSSEHGLNSVEVGPDGMLYLAVGGVYQLWNEPELVARLEHVNRDWIGTILRVDPATSAVEVVATGLRNVYAMTFAPDGRLLAVDNDGSSQAGWRSEELLEIVKGRDYGYPSGRSGQELTTVGGYGTAALRWHEDQLLIGSCFAVFSVRLVDADGTYRAVRRPTEVSGVDGCVTGIQPLDDGRLLLATFYHNALRILQP